MRSHKKFVLDRFSSFNVYWIQTDKQSINYICAERKYEFFSVLKKVIRLSELSCFILKINQENMFDI